MKKCPHCGADLTDGATSFCPACGKETEILENRKSAKKKGKKKSKSKNKKQKKAETIPEVMGEPVDDGYDGYYNDVLPPDQDRISEGLDEELVKNIVNAHIKLSPRKRIVLGGVVSAHILHKKAFPEGNCLKEVNGGSHFWNPPFFQAVILQPLLFGG